MLETERLIRGAILGAAVLSARMQRMHGTGRFIS